MMPGCYNGRILRVDLSRGKWSVEEPGEGFYRQYLGGRALGLYYLLKELDPETQPFDEENIIIFAPSVVTGAPLPGLGRHSVLSKSPLTGGFAESEAGGFWGVELKKAGFDAVIVRGRASEPVYLWIKDGQVEIKSAKHLWGLDTGNVQQRIRMENGDDKIRVALIGKAGENLVRYAAVVNDLKHVNGRAGLGAVMGSKNLKGVAVRGTRSLEVADREKLQDLARFFGESFKKNADNNQLNQYGTSQYFINASHAGALPTRNFREGTFEGAEKVCHTEMYKKLTVGHEGCFACPVRCKTVCKSDGPIKIDPQYGGPEFESMTAFSALCGNDNLETMVKANELSNRYGIDSIATGASIAFAMECFEKGLITTEDTGGIELKFGNHEAILVLIEQIVNREGFGNLLAEGTKRMSEKIGRGSEKFAMHVKGQEFAMHEPRVKFGVGLAYAVSPTGGDHLQHEHDGAFDPALVGYTHESDKPSVFMEMVAPLGILRPVETLSIGVDKVRMFTYLQMYWSFFNSIEFCIFTFAPVRTFLVEQIPEIVKAVTGWNMSLWELMKVGERGITMARLFNLKHGLSAKDDYLPERSYEPLEKGALEGTRIPREEFASAIPMYYEMMGWDGETGVPTRGKLAELNILWAE